MLYTSSSIFISDPTDLAAVCECVDYLSTFKISPTIFHVGHGRWHAIVSLHLRVQLIGQTTSAFSLAGEFLRFIK